MPGKLYIIANATDVGLDFANTEHPLDDLTVDDHIIKYSVGTGGDFCLIPTCEREEDFDAHHMSVELDGGFTICFWKNNSEGNVVYYSTSGGFTPHNPMPGGDIPNSYDHAALMVYGSQRLAGVHMSNVTDHN